MADDKGWVDEVVAKLEGAVDGVIEVEIGGQKLSAVLGPEVVKFFRDNKVLLIRLGRQTFKDFILLISEKRDEEAFQLLLSKMEAADIIARMNMNAEALKYDNDLHDQFMAALKKFAMGVLTSLTAKIIVGLLV